MQYGDDSIDLFEKRYPSQDFDSFRISQALSPFDNNGSSLKSPSGTGAQISTSEYSYGCMGRRRNRYKEDKRSKIPVVLEIGAEIFTRS